MPIDTILEDVTFSAPIKILSAQEKKEIENVEKELKTGKALVTETYLVNSSGIVLDSVIATTGGPARGYADDPEFLEAFHRSVEVIEYTNVANGEAVRIFEHERIYDSDWMLSIGFEVKMNDKLVKLNSSFSKVTKGFEEEALLY